VTEPGVDSWQDAKQQPYQTVHWRNDGGLEFSSDNAVGKSVYRAKELLRLLRWFPLKATSAEQVVVPAHSERLTLADVALHLWSLSRDPGQTPIEKQSHFQFVRFLQSFRMLPGFFGRKAAFFQSEVASGLARADANLIRSMNPPGYDEEALLKRLRRAGVTEKVAERDVWFEEIREPAFPITIDPVGLPAIEQGHLAYLREELKDGEQISLAKVEALLIERNRHEPGWYRSFTA
jgi:hypothetical protein